MSALADTMSKANLPIYELRQPKPGLRHNQTERLIHHRFPVKGGLTPGQVMIRMMEKQNELFQMVKRRSPNPRAAYMRQLMRQRRAKRMA